MCRRDVLKRLFGKHEEGNRLLCGLMGPYVEVLNGTSVYTGCGHEDGNEITGMMLNVVST